MYPRLRDMKEGGNREYLEGFLAEYDKGVEEVKKSSSKLKYLYVKIKNGSIDQSPEGKNDWVGVDESGVFMYELYNVPNQLIQNNCDTFIHDTDMIGVLYTFTDLLKDKSETFLRKYYHFCYEISYYTSK